MRNRRPVLYVIPLSMAMCLGFSGLILAFRIEGDASGAGAGQSDLSTEPSLQSRSLPPAGDARTFQSSSSPLGQALAGAAETAEMAVKSIGQSIGQYVTDIQVQRQQKRLADNFYQAFDVDARPLYLAPGDYRELRRRVEDIYIEDEESGRRELDPIYFRQMAFVVKHAYGEMRLETAPEGPVETYYPNGRAKTLWQFHLGQPHGTVVTHYEDGEILYIDAYDQGRRLNRKKYDPQGRLEFSQDYDYEVSPAEALAEAPSLKAS